jgi:hypothetical protein
VPLALLSLYYRKVHAGTAELVPRGRRTWFPDYL